ADEILDLFPTMLALEKLGDNTPGAEASDPAGLAQPALVGEAPLRDGPSGDGTSGAGQPGHGQLGDLRLVREVGRGGMGVVYEAVQQSLGRRVAVKVLPQRTLFDTQRLERFRREARTAAALQHPHIVPIYGVGEQDGIHYLTMQLIDGAGLDEVAKLVGDSAGALRDATGKTNAGGGATSRIASRLAHALVAGGFDTTLTGSQAWGAGAGATDASPHGDNLPGPATKGHGDDATAAFSGSTLRDTPGGLLDTSGGVSLHVSPQDAGPVSAHTAAPPALPAVGADYYAGVAKIGIETAEALAYAHARGTMHRDIKPANLLLDQRGCVWITDFGLAKAIDPLQDDGVSRTGEMVGTLRYMAPEQLRGEADPRSDLYSLGLTLYELVTWRPAFEASAPSELIRKITAEPPATPRRLNPGAPRDLETIILKAMAPDPADRYQTGDDLAADLRRFRDAIPIAAKRASPAGRARRWLRQNPVTAGLSAAVVLLACTTLWAVGGYTGLAPTPPFSPTSPAAETGAGGAGDGAAASELIATPRPPAAPPMGPPMGPPGIAAPPDPPPGPRGAPGSWPPQRGPGQFGGREGPPRSPPRERPPGPPRPPQQGLGPGDARGGFGGPPGNGPPGSGRLNGPRGTGRLGDRPPRGPRRGNGPAPPRSPGAPPRP
ncbi:MAG: serine/threonine-protein kinase, partial [Planctomycetota bacterium]